MKRLLELRAILTCSAVIMACSTDPEGEQGPGPGDGDDLTSTGGSAQPASGGALGTGGGAAGASGGARARGGQPTADGAGGAAQGAGGGEASGGAHPAETSLGCGTATELVTGKTTVDVDGTSREYILTLPENYDAQKPHRLVFGFHGRQYDAEWVAEGKEPLTGPYFGLQELSEDSTVFVAPQALSTSWSNENGRDIGFVTAMLDTLEAQLCIDVSRVFAVGFSYGAIMTATIGCELYERFTAVAPMSASLPGSCTNDLPPLAYWGSHGTEDQTIKLVQGEAVRDSYVARNHCEDTPGAADANGCVTYPGCDEGAPTVWCTFSGEHVPAPFAGPAIWPFFAQF